MTKFVVHEGGSSRKPDQKLRINARDRDLPTVTSDAWDALCQANDPPYIFNRGGQLCRLERSPTGAPILKPITQDRFRYELARAADWYCYEVRKDGSCERVPAIPLLDVVRDMLADPQPPLPLLVGITTAPAFNRDGSLHCKPGYSRIGQTYYAPARRFEVPPVPESPTPAQIRKAVALLNQELLHDFPFVDPADGAHALSLLIVPFVRSLIHGPGPLHLIEKPTPGSGGTLLANVLAYPSQGRPLTAMTEGRDEDEWRKRVTAKLRSDPPIILIDNLNRKLDSPALAAAITSMEWEDRLLGKSETIQQTVRCAWAATGNNPTLSNELLRRAIRIRLDPGLDRPWLRDGFRRPNLLEWVAAHRADLCHAALTLARTWIAADQPKPNTPTLGMFESWSEVIGGILEVAGVQGFLGNLDEFYSVADAEEEVFRMFLEGWLQRPAKTAVKAANLYDTAVNNSLDLGQGSQQSQKIRLGKILASMRDRVFTLDGGETVRVVKAGVQQRAVRWKLEKV